MEALYREHGRALFRYLVRMTGDADLADDVMHDAFQRLLERPPRRDTNLKGWLFRVATNRLRDSQRQSARQLRLLADRGAAALQADPPPPPDRAVLVSEARARARTVLDALNERDRAILLMREEGFTHREIAQAVGTTTKSVGTLIARALDRVMATAVVLENES